MTIFTPKKDLPLNKTALPMKTQNARYAKNVKLALAAKNVKSVKSVKSAANYLQVNLTSQIMSRLIQVLE